MSEKNDWSPYLRGFKIGMVSGERPLEIKKECVQRFARELRFIRSEFPNDVITGSLALNLYGLIDRNIGDIDIMISDGSRYSGYSKGYKYGVPKDGEQALDNRLGYIVFEERQNLPTWLPDLSVFRAIARLMDKPKKYEIDFFEMPAASFETFEFEGHEYKLQSAVRIVEAKCELERNSIRGYSREKHERDLFCIFG